MKEPLYYVDKRRGKKVYCKFFIVKKKLVKVQELRRETQESLSMRERKFLAYDTQLSGSEHGRAESTRKCTLRDFEATWENVCEDIMLTNDAHFIYIYTSNNR